MSTGLNSTKWPHGNRNRITGNDGGVRQLHSVSVDRAVDWTDNYFGPDVRFVRNLSNCLGAPSNPAAGYLEDSAGHQPISNSSYYHYPTTCYRDAFKIEEGDFAIDGTYLIESGQTVGVGSFGENPTALIGGNINSRTGAFTTSHVDVTMPGLDVPFALTRQYSGTNLEWGLMGPGWSSFLDTRLFEGDYGIVDVVAPDGQGLTFRELANGTYAGPSGARGHLTHDAVADEYTLQLMPSAETLVFNGDGRILTWAGRNGHGLGFAYASGVLDAVTDSAGRVIDVTITSGLITQLQLPDTRSISYSYTSGRLTGVTDMRGKTTTYSYDAFGRLVQGVDARSHNLFIVTYAASGRVSAIEDARGNDRTFTWDQPTQTATLTDQAGKEWQDVYDEGVRIKAIDPLGAITEYAYDAGLNVDATIDARGHETKMTYDTRGNMLTREAPAPLSYQEEWTYDTFGNPLTHEDGRGNTTSYEYDADGNLERETKPGGIETEYALDPGGTGLLDSVTDPNGHVTSFDYDADFNRDEQVTPEGNKTTWTYDQTGRMTSMVEPRGNVSGAAPANFETSYTWDAENNKLTETDPLGHVTTWTWDDVGNLASEKDADNKTTSYGYDDANNRTSTTAPDATVTSVEYDSRGNVVARVTDLGNRTTYEYDDAGRKVAMVAPRGNELGATPANHTWIYEYDQVGNRTQVIDPLDRETTYTYDELNREKTVTDGESNTTTWGYDANSNRTSRTDAASNSETWTFDPLDRMTSHTSRRNKTTSYDYDDVGNAIAVTAPSGGVTSRVFDSDDQLVKLIDPRGNESGTDPDDFATIFDYDPAGNRISVADPLGNETTWSYDRDGRMTAKTDANNHATTFAYDVVDRLTSVTDPANETTVYAYDAVGNLLTRTDANAHVSSMTYDDDRRLVTLTKPGSRVYDYGYDPDGNRTIREDANGNDTGTVGDGTTFYDYDAAGQLTTIDYSDATPDVAFDYDGVGNRVEMTDGNGVETRVYDDLNQLTSVVRGSDTFSFGHDDDGHIDQRTYPSGLVSTFAWDDDSRLSSVTVSGDTTSYDYDAAGNLVETTLPAGNGHVEERAYDRAGRLERITNASSSGTLSEEAYTRDAVGNPLEIDLPGGAVETYEYDELDRITQACYQASCTNPSDPYIRYSYDAVGNRLVSETPSATVDYDYNAADELVQTDDGTTVTAYAYDKNGNQLTSGSDSFEYDLDNRMVEADKAGVIETYSYDGDGKRSTVTVGGITTESLWDVTHRDAQLAVERISGGAVQRSYTYGHRRIAMHTGSNEYYYHHGLVDNVLNVTDSTGAEQWSYRYDPFGGAIVETKIDPAAPMNPMRFSGEYLDSTGLMHLRARQYDPVSGRFSSVDPITPDIDDPYVSHYLYSSNRPGVLVDPSGMKSRTYFGSPSEWQGITAGGLAALRTCAQDGTSVSCRAITSAAFYALIALLSSYTIVTMDPGSNGGDGAYFADGGGGDRDGGDEGPGANQGGPGAGPGSRPGSDTRPGGDSGAGGDGRQGSGGGDAGTASDDGVVPPSSTDDRPDFNDPTKPPGGNDIDWDWHGVTDSAGRPVNGKGNWVNRETGEQWHPDLEHGPPAGPHWDYRPGRGLPDYRWYPNPSPGGTFIPKRGGL